MRKASVMKKRHNPFSYEKVFVLFSTETANLASIIFGCSLSPFYKNPRHVFKAFSKELVTLNSANAIPLFQRDGKIRDRTGTWQSVSACWGRVKDSEAVSILKAFTNSQWKYC